MEPIVGQLMLFAGNFAPVGWATCDGQLLPIRQYTALFSLLGTNYGGDGKVTFGLPDLRGRIATHYGQGPGLTNKYSIGEEFGSLSVKLNDSNTPPHTHLVSGTVNLGCNSTDQADSNSPFGCYLKQTPGTDTYSGSATGVMGNSPVSDLVISECGGTTPVQLSQPTLGMNYCIALVGNFPQRP